MRSMKHHTFGMAAVQMFLKIFLVCIINGRGEVTMGSNVRLTDDESFLYSELSKNGYGWDLYMREMYGKCFEVITSTGPNGDQRVVGLPSPDGSQNGVWYFPPSVLSKCETPAPTEEPTCIEKKTWTEEVAGNNCPAESTYRVFGIEACDPSYQERLEVSLANQLYKNCKSKCVYDYDTILADAKAAFKYKERKKCYKYVTRGVCLRKNRYDTAVERAKTLC